MRRAGVVGLGDMGSGIARNLMTKGIQTTGFDLDEARMLAFGALGGRKAASPAEVGETSEAVFVMVMNGDQAKSVILGDGLASRMAPGSVVILTATVHPHEAREIGEALDGTGVLFVDSPVSGGFSGAQSGELTLMAAGSDAAMDSAEAAMAAVSKAIFRVGREPGMGQSVKACLQSLMGAVFCATCEAAALAARSGVDAQTFVDVVDASSAGCVAARTALENIVEGVFSNSGSHIDTMHKDLTIALTLAQSLRVPLHTTATAMQVFTAARSRFPDGDNWAIARMMEEIVGAELRRGKAAS